MRLTMSDLQEGIARSSIGLTARIRMNLMRWLARGAEVHINEEIEVPDGEVYAVELDKDREFIDCVIGSKEFILECRKNK